MLSNLNLKSLENGKQSEEMKDFLEECYLEEIKEYETNPIKSSSFYIGMDRLREYDRDLYKKFRENAKQYLYNSDRALKTILLEETTLTKSEISDYVVRLENCQNKVRLRNIRQKHINSLISVECSVSKKAKVNPVLVKATFECQNCKNEIEVDQTKLNSDEPTYPNSCDECDQKRKKGFSILPEKSEFENHQEITIQEHPETTPSGERPMETKIVINGDITGRVKPGERVEVIGVVNAILEKSRGILKNKRAKIQIRGVSVIPEEKDYDELDITEEDVDRIKEISQKDNIYEKFVSSIAPTIKGYEVEKKGIVLQLFSGIRKQTYDTSVRGDIHILLVGDPSTGKSQILQHVGELTPRGMYTSGKGVSEAGLTAAAIQESELGGDYVLEAGVLPLSDKGIACVDEIDKMDKGDRSSMHEALEQQTVSINKAGINTHLNSRCALLAAANPEGDRFNSRKSVAEQIDLEPALVSRFDLIFTFKDNADEETDRQISDHILDTHIKGEKNIQGEISEDEVTPEIPQDMIKKYIAYSRQEIDPIISDKAKEYIQETYMEIRNQSDSDNEGVISITHRKLEAIIRLTEASARLRLSEKATIEDAKSAVEILKTSLRQTGYDSEAGRYDVDKIEAGETKTDRDRKIVKNAIEKLENMEERESVREEVIKEVKKEGLKEDKIESVISDLRRENEIYRKKTDEFQVL